MKESKDVQPKKLKELAICTPSRDGMYPMNFVSSMESLLKVVPNGWDFKYSLVRGTSDIVNARNAFINKWYYETKSDAMLFVDSDIGFHGEIVSKLIEHSEKNGVYSKTQHNTASQQHSIKRHSSTQHSTSCSTTHHNKSNSKRAATARATARDKTQHNTT